MTSRYKKSLPSTLQEAWTQAENDDTSITLRDELALLRSILTQYLKENSGDIDKDFIKSVTTLVDKIQDVQCAVIEHETKMKGYISAKTVERLVDAIVSVVRKRIADEKVVDIISEDISRIPITGPGQKLLPAEPKIV